VDGETVGEIGAGLVVLLGIEQGDRDDELIWCVQKTVGLRIFPDADEKMNLSLKDISGEMLVVSQFTLCADIEKGKRPSFIRAADPQIAQQMYEQFCAQVARESIRVATGIFAAKMTVSIVNEGPVTIIVERNKEQGTRNKEQG
jgi:D-tyrosyl-tRNA(Tyr) deacylase